MRLWKAIVLGCLMYTALGLAGGAARADDGAATATTPAAQGIAATDTISGNGGRSGYVLSHSGFVRGSESVSIGGVAQIRDKDYTIDSSTSAIVFMKPVKSDQKVTVNYRYDISADVLGNATTDPSMALKFGQTTSAGVMLGYTTASSDSAYDLTTYGLNINTSLGGASNMSNMFYYTTPKANGKSSNSTSELTTDNMFVHSSSLQAGSLGIKVSYQDVGAGFSGFTALREQKVASDSVLNQLEKEKGIKRMGLQADYALGKGMTTALAWSSIGDGSGSITQQSLSFANSSMKLSANMRSVGAGFTRFGDLAEGDRGQWANERGVTHTGYQLAFAPMKGMAADSAWNALSFSDVSNATGSASVRALNFATKGFSLSARNTSVDAGFTGLAALSGAERNEMALAIRQQFDSGAAVGAVTDADRNYVASSRGIERQFIRGAMAMKNGQASLQFLNVDTASGSARRQTLAVQGTGWGVTAFTQSIDSGAALSSLAAVEQANFGSEAGMDRMNLSAYMSMKSGTTLTADFADVSSSNGGLFRAGFGMTAKYLTLSAHMVDIDPSFTGAAYLADSDRATLASEIGMRRYDLTTRLIANKALTIDSYLYDAQHSTNSAFNQELRNILTYAPSKGPKITYLRDDKGYGNDAYSIDYLREYVTFEHKLGVLNVTGSQNTETTGSTGSATYSDLTRLLHFSTDTKGRLSATGDWKLVKDGSERTFTDTQTLNLAYNMSSKLSFTGVQSTTKTQSDTTVTRQIGATQKATKGLNVGLAFGETLTNGSQVGTVNQISLSPTDAKDIGILKQFKWALSYSQAKNSGVTQVGSSAVGFEANIADHKVAASYSSAENRGSNVDKFGSSFSVASSTDPKKPLQYRFSYNPGSPSAGLEAITREYSVAWALSTTSKLAYDYTSRPASATTEKMKDSGKVSLSAPLAKGLSFVGQWEGASNEAEATSKDVLSMGLSGKLSPSDSLEASYGFGRSLSGSGLIASHTYRLKYDLRKSENHYLALSGLLVDWVGDKPSSDGSEDIQIQLDFKTIFD